MADKPTIVAAAIFHGACISLPPPARHHTILHFMSCELGVETMTIPPVNQGFLTSEGKYVNRTEGFYIAHRAGQLNDRERGPEPQLYSEDMW